MKFKEIPEWGQALIVVGGAVLAGTVISILSEEDEPPREARKKTMTRRSTPKTLELVTDDKGNRWSKKDWERISQYSKDYFLKPKESVSTTKYLVEVTNPGQISKSISRGDKVNSENSRKYPDHYYSLSKQQQYKYRSKMAKELTEISKEK